MGSMSDIVIDVDPASVQRIRDTYGEVAAQEYGGMYATRQREVDDRIRRLEEADTEEFIQLTYWAILTSARMNGYKGNFEDVHVIATVAHNISNRRGEAAGEDPRCRVHSLYHQGWLKAYKSQGHYYGASDDCLCGTEANVA